MATDPYDRDLWFKTDTEEWHRREGGAWVKKTGLGALGQALLSAAGAHALADSKVTTFYTSVAPTTGMKLGDLWINPDENPRRVRTWDGDSWELSSDVTATVQPPGPPDTEFNFTHLIQPEADEFPRTLNFILKSGNGQVTSGIAWKWKVESGKVNGLDPSSPEQTMTGTGTGKLVVNSLEADSRVTVTATVGQQVYPGAVDLKQIVAAAPATGGTTGGNGGTGGGGTTTPTQSTSQTSGFLAFSSATPIAVSNELEWVQPAGRTDASIAFTTGKFRPSGNTSGSWDTNATLQWHNGTAWADAGLKSGPVRSQVIYSELGTPEEPDPVLTIAPASHSFSRTLTGLTPGATYKARLMADLDVVSVAVRTHTVTGSLQVTA